jgi:AcrR family transcriptional regulator
MRRTRSRPKTEEKFQNAVLQLVAKEGCGALGINAVAQQAGADKVLIYRYFGDFNGLLARVAESRPWLPTSVEVYNTLPSGTSGPEGVLRHVKETIIRHIRADASTHQLVRWRRANICPICRRFSEEWRALWKTLPPMLSDGLDSGQRQLWKQACALLALIIEAELCDEPVERACLERVAAGLTAITVETNAGPVDFMADDHLPTNLL